MSTEATQRRYEDVNENDFFMFEKPPVTKQQLVMYAGASGDYNRIHYDHHFAVEAGLGGVIAHGMLVMGFLSQTVVMWGGKGAFVTEVRSRFVAPVRPGDSVVFDGRVVGKEVVDGKKLCRLEVEGVANDRTVIKGSAVIQLSDGN